MMKMGEKPPNFRFVETTTCERCWGSVYENSVFVCQRHGNFIIDIPNHFICDDYQLERNEDE